MPHLQIREIFDAKTHRVSKNAYPTNTKFPGTRAAGKCFVTDGACTYIVKGERVTIKAGEFADLPQGDYKLEVSGNQAVASGARRFTFEIFSAREVYSSKSYSNGEQTLNRLSEMSITLTRSCRSGSLPSRYIPALSEHSMESNMQIPGCKDVLTRAFGLERFAVLTLLLAGCATVQGYKDTLQTWMGQSDSALMQVWGQPDSIGSLPNGMTLLQYDRARTAIIPGYTYNQPVTTTHNGTITGDVNANYSGTSTTYVPQTTPSTAINMQCSTRFTVNQSHVIVAYAFNGNACKAKAPDNAVVNSNRSDVKAGMAEFSARYTAICKKPEYASFMANTACAAKDITFEQLASNKKPSDEDKAILLKWRTETDTVSSEQRSFMRKHASSSSDYQWVDYVDSTQDDIQKYNLQFYNGELTWGQYNQLRKALQAQQVRRYKEIFPSS